MLKGEEEIERRKEKGEGGGEEEEGRREGEEKRRGEGGELTWQRCDEVSLQHGHQNGVEVLVLVKRHP